MSDQLTPIPACLQTFDIPFDPTRDRYSEEEYLDQRAEYLKLLLLIDDSSKEA